MQPGLEVSSLSDLEINSFFVVSLIAATLCLFSAWLGPGSVIPGKDFSRL